MAFNKFKMILDNYDRLVLNDQSITSPHNVLQWSPGFVFDLKIQQQIVQIKYFFLNVTILFNQMQPYNLYVS